MDPFTRHGRVRAIRQSTKTLLVLIVPYQSAKRLAFAGAEDRAVL